VIVMDIPCRRCFRRNAMRRRCDAFVALLFMAAVAADLEAADVRLCSSCEKTLESLRAQVTRCRAQPRKRRPVDSL
jgi:hypothetical protein